MISPMSDAENVTFSMYKWPPGDTIEPGQPIVTATLLINPDNISIRQNRITERVQTGVSMYHFLDWGPDAMIISMDIHTGYLLKHLSQSTNTPKTLKELINTGKSYLGMIKDSEAYARVKSLEKIVKTYNAEEHFVILKVLGQMFRGYISNYTVSYNEESPWQWKLHLEFTVVASSAEAGVMFPHIDFSRTD